MAKPWTCPCGALNRGQDRTCEACDQPRRASSSEPYAPGGKIRTICDCGATLDATGLCRVAGGYPATMACPFACPICRGVLSWSGGCERCHGCTSGRREDWTFPGARYELEKGHWQLAETVTGRAACTREENLAGLAEVRHALAGSLLTRNTLGLPAIDPAVQRDVAARAR